MCLFPINAELPPEGGRPVLDKEGSLKLPCGKCNECISKRAIEWATRAKHEISEHSENSFITLTYNSKNLNSNFIIKSDFQKFVKRLRKKLKHKIRYMVSYEYGSQYFRPHMHAIFFGYNPSNQTFLKKTSSGHPLFTSTEIEKLWDKGFHSVGTANERTAYYIASYALKGKTKTIYHPDTGESCEVSDTMDVSKRPAIGLNYLLKNYQQLVDSGEMLPRYYQKKLEEFNPELFEVYQNNVNLKLKTRSSQELHAKFIIDSQKINGSDSFYREISDDNQETKKRKFYERQLKANRDDYVSYNRSKNVCKNYSPSKTKFQEHSFPHSLCLPKGTLKKALNK